LSRCSAMPTAASRVMTRLFRSAAGVSCTMSRGYSMFSYTVSTGSRLKSWKMKPIFRPLNDADSLRFIVATSRSMTRRVPPLGRSRQPIMFSRVDLPLPEGPTKETKDSGAMEKSIPRMASTSTSPTLYVFLSPRACTSAIGNLLSTCQAWHRSKVLCRSKQTPFIHSKFGDQPAQYIHCGPRIVF